MQVDPMKPMLKAPGTKGLKLRYGESPSSFAFEFNLRRCNQVNLEEWQFFLKGGMVLAGSLRYCPNPKAYSLKSKA
jgi:hypothetical protein